MTADNQESTDDTSGGIDQRAMESGTLVQEAKADPGPVDGAALAVAAAIKAGVYHPGKSTVEDAVSQCIIVENMTEKIVKLSIEDGGSAGIGTTVSYTDELFDSADKQLGTSNATGVVLCMTPHMWQFHRMNVELDDGTLEATGMLNATAMKYGMTQALEVTGRTGRYAGKVGYLTIAITDPTQRPPHYTTSFVVC